MAAHVTIDEARFTIEVDAPGTRYNRIIVTEFLGGILINISDVLEASFDLVGETLRLVIRVTAQSFGSLLAAFEETRIYIK